MSYWLQQVSESPQYVDSEAFHCLIPNAKTPKQIAALSFWSVVFSMVISDFFSFSAVIVLLYRRHCCCHLTVGGAVVRRPDHCWLDNKIRSDQIR